MENIKKSKRKIYKSKMKKFGGGSRVEREQRKNSMSEKEGRWDLRTGDRE